MICYGVAGVGKTSFGATFERPILLPTEEGASSVDVDSFPMVTCFQDIVDVITALHEDHQYKTLILDSLDWTESHVWQATCEANDWPSIEKPGYGKGYVESDRYWAYIRGGLDSLRANKNMTILLLAHSEVKRVEPPELEAYDRYQMRLHKRAFSMWTEWADAVMFLHYKVHVQKTDQGYGNERVRGVGSGERIIHTTERPAWDAKNRWSLPEEILIGKDRQWKAFHEQLEAATGGKYKSPYNNGKGE
jgi:hypothetical protein